ncbi:MAG: nucleoside recognition protein [Lachnospiraceae bacterium]|nr:nucleoside recognition protein [Lachnospiraceae bacterium]
MLNQIWALMISIGFVYGVIVGNLQEMTDSMLGAAGEAVDLSLTLLGVVAFWCGVMEIAQEAGLVRELSRRMKPVIQFLFPQIPENHRSLEAISMNFIANILGLGWAATPAGLKAMEALTELEKERDAEYRAEQEAGCRTEHRAEQKAGCRTEYQAEQKADPESHIASNEMCTFLVLNISSLQLIPVNIIAYRSQYGSADPAAVIGPAILATSVSTAAAVVICKFLTRKRTAKKV